MTQVALEHVTVRRQSNTILDDVSLEAPPGSLTVVIGPSGAGKTSLLRTITGLDPVDSGTIRFDDVDVTGASPSQRNTSFVPHEPALLGVRSVARNIAMPLEARRQTATEIADRIGVQTHSLRIGHLLARSAAELSAGEAQMVQVARALVHMPDVLLLDEPFAAIEGERSSVLRRELRYLQLEFGVTTFMATNDPADVADVADRIVVMEQGRMVQVGTFAQVFEHPRTAASAVLTGDASIDRVSVEPDGGGAWLVHPDFRVRAWASNVRAHAGRDLLMITRPEWWQPTVGAGDVAGTVVRTMTWSGAATTTVDIGGREIVVRQPAGDVGEQVRLKLQRWVLLDPLDGFAIR